MGLETVMFSGISDIHKHKYHMVSLIGETQSVNNLKTKIKDGL